MENIEILPELENLIAPLSNEELTMLEGSILKDGCLDSLKVWSTGESAYLLDGHNRQRICREHNIPFKTEVIESVTCREEAISWMVNLQLGRRNLTNYQRAELALTAKSFLAEAAKQRQREAGGDKRSASSKKTVRPISTEAILVEKNNKGDANFTSTILAQQAGLGKTIIKQAAYIQSHADEQTKEKLRKGELTINKAYKSLRRKNEIRNAGKNKLLPHQQNTVGTKESLHTRQDDVQKIVAEIDSHPPPRRKMKAYPKVLAKELIGKFHEAFKDYDANQKLRVMEMLMVYMLYNRWDDIKQQDIDGLWKKVISNGKHLNERQKDG